MWPHPTVYVPLSRRVLKLFLAYGCHGTADAYILIRCLPAKDTGSTFTQNLQHNDDGYFSRLLQVCCHGSAHRTTVREIVEDLTKPYDTITPLGWIFCHTDTLRRSSDKPVAPKSRTLKSGKDLLPDTRYPRPEPCWRMRAYLMDKRMHRPAEVILPCQDTQQKDVCGTFPTRIH